MANLPRVLLITALLVNSCNGSMAPSDMMEQKPKVSGLIFNQDCTQFFGLPNFLIEGRDGGAELDKLVDQFAEAGVKTIMWNTNDQRTSYRSDVWQRAWDGFDPTGTADQPFFSAISDTAERNAYYTVVRKMWALDGQGVD